MSITADAIANPRLTRKSRKYYLADEVDRHLLRVAEGTQSDQARLSEQATRLNELLVANQKQSAVISAYHEKAVQGDSRLAEQDQQIAEQVREIGALGSQLSAYRSENTSQSERIARQNLQLSHMQARIAQLEEQVRLMESQKPDDVMRQAAEKADAMITKAVADSERIMMQATEQRGRLIAACRAAYYSALQFKQDLADQFRNMERELDASIDVLQLMDNSPLALNHKADTAEPGGDQDAITP